MACKPLEQTAQKTIAGQKLSLRWKAVHFGALYRHGANPAHKAASNHFCFQAMVPFHGKTHARDKSTPTVQFCTTSLKADKLALCMKYAAHRISDCIEGAWRAGR
jgi:hypothetical protein